MLLRLRASRRRRGGFECRDVPDRDDGGRRLSAGLQTEVTQSVSAHKHTDDHTLHTRPRDAAPHPTNRVYRNI